MEWHKIRLIRLWRTSHMKRKQLFWTFHPENFGVFWCFCQCIGKDSCLYNPYILVKLLSNDCSTNRNVRRCQVQPHNKQLNTPAWFYCCQLWILLITSSLVLSLPPRQSTKLYTTFSCLLCPVMEILPVWANLQTTTNETEYYNLGTHTSLDRSKKEFKWTLIKISVVGGRGIKIRLKNTHKWTSTRPAPNQNQTSTRPNQSMDARKPEYVPNYIFLKYWHLSVIILCITIYNSQAQRGKLGCGEIIAGPPSASEVGCRWHYSCYQTSLLHGPATTRSVVQTWYSVNKVTNGHIEQI